MENLNLDKFNPTKAELLTLADEGRKLVIKGVDDKEGYLAVHQQRIKLKNARVQIAKTGKEAREEALAYQKKVIAYEKELIAIIEPIEADLQAKQDAVDVEREKAKRVALLPERQEKLMTIGNAADDELLLAMDDTQFQEFFNERNSIYLAEKEAKIKAEQEKIEAEKLKLAEAQRIEEAKKQAEKEAHEKAMRDAELAKVKAEEDKKAAVQAEKDKAAAEKRKMVEEQERKEAARKEAEAKVKAEAEAKSAKEKAEQEALEKRKKYQNFLEKYSYKDDGTFYIQKVGNKITLFKKVGEMTV